MGTSAGPSLQGIGRGGDSNLVLEMDAHDAKSYPGEPTTNLIPYYSSRNTALVASVFSHEALWTSRADSTDVIAPDGSSTTTKAVTGTSGNSYLYTYMDDVLGVTMASNTTYTLSVWAKTTSTASTTVSLAFQDRGNGAYNTSVKTITTEWQRFSFTITTGSGATSSTLVGWFSPTHSRTFYFWGWQVEQKAYATPYVVSQHLDPTAQGPSARPASVDLMIHGNVGTGTTFEDSSPRKLALTNTNGVSHAGTSEFGGSALKFVRSSSQRIEVASSDAGNFGTGDWTIDYWFNMTSGQTDRMHSISMGTYASSNISLNFNDGNAFWLYWNGSGSPNIIFGSDGDYGDGAWHHMAVTRASGMIRVWVDGVHKGSSNYSSSTSMGSTNVIDIGSSGGGVLWDGYLDEIRITKGTALWVGSGNFTPPTRRNLSAPVVDRSGNDNGGNFNTTDMTDVSTYRVGEVIRPIGDAVWDFDGTDDEINMGHAGGAFKKDGIDRTIAQWVMSPTATATYMSSLGYRKSADETGGWMIYWRAGYIRIWNNGGSHSPEVIGVSPNNAFAANTVYHVVATWPGTSGQPVKLYINGEYISAADGTTGTSADSTSNELSIGRYGANSGFHYTGKVYNTQIYDTILTAQQVKENFNQQRNRFKI